MDTLVFVSAGRSFAPAYESLSGYRILEIAAAKGYMDSLIESRAAMIVIDGGHAQWRDFVIAPKASAATRRIPMVVVSGDEGLRVEALRSGADYVMSPEAFIEHCGEFVAEHARIPDAELLERLACGCREPLPELAERGLEEFNKGNYYRQHDLFEEQWMRTEGPARDLYRAILQVGVAYYQIERGNYRGALKMLQRSVQWLHILPGVCQGVDVEQLRRDSYAVRAELQRLGPEGISQFDVDLLKPIVWSRAGDGEV